MTTPMFSLTLETRLGADLEKSIIEAFRISKLLNVSVNFEFNGERLNVNPDEDIDNWFRRHKKLLGL